MDFPFVKEAISQLFSKPSCAMYPAVESVAAPRYRGRIAFYPDKCINCMMCERVCCGGAITHTVEKTEEGDKVTRSFNLGCCTFCAHCMDFCTHGAIELTQDRHEGRGPDRLRHLPQEAAGEEGRSAQGARRRSLGCGCSRGGKAGRPRGSGRQSRARCGRG